MIILPWCVDVPEDRRPVANWLIVAVTVGVFVLQIVAMAQHSAGPHAQGQEPVTLGFPYTWVLNGWGLKGLFGYMWLHGGVLHLLGNMWFLWIFGNAVCAKVGNLRYLVLYVLLGVVAGVTHLLFTGGTAVGASGAINGIVGMYLVLFYENSITCYWWFLLVFFRQFTVSSVWMILFWLSWDIFGAVVGGEGVAYFAHLGGFGAGFVIALYMCKKDWITMERYEKSLWQWWQQRKGGASQTSLDHYAQLGLAASPPDEPPMSPVPMPMSPLKKPNTILRPSLSDTPTITPPDDRWRVTCSCGKTVKLSPQYAGKVVRCPHCRASLPLGHGPRPRPEVRPPSESVTTSAPGDSRYIRFTCTCGKRIKVPSHYAGRSGKCPQCGIRLKIPHGDT